MSDIEPAVTLHTGDAIEILRTLDAESVQTCVTSPPYYGLRSYGDDAQEIGREGSVNEYVQNLVEVFREVRRLLRPDGTLWLVLGDSYCSTDKWGGGHTGNTGKQTVEVNGNVPSWIGRERRKKQPGIKPKDLLLVPAQVALALQTDGWWLQRHHLAQTQRHARLGHRPLHQRL